MKYPISNINPDKERQNFMEIGGGNGLFASILSRKYKPKNYIMIDLPETLVNTYCYLSNCSNEYDIFLPNSFNICNLSSLEI